MKVMLKYKIFNKYIISSFFLIIFLSFFSWAIFSEFFSALFIWDTSPYTKREYINLIFPFCNYPVDGYSLLQLIAPVFPVLAVMPFFETKKLFSYAIIKNKSYKKFIIQNIFSHLLIASMTLYLAYLIFLSIGIALLPIKPDEGVGRELFSEIFGKSFYKNHMIIYFVIEGLLKYVIFTFVYGLFSIALSFITKKNYLCVLIPIAYYNVLAILVAVLETTFKINLLFLSPTYTLLSNSREYTNGFLIIAPLLIPLIFSTFILHKEINIRKKRDDIYAIN